MNDLYKKEIELLYRLRQRGLIPQSPSTTFKHPKVMKLAEALLTLESQMGIIDREIYQEYFSPQENKD